MANFFETTVKGRDFEEIPLSASQEKSDNFLSSLLGSVPDFPTQGVEGLTGVENMGQQLLEAIISGKDPDYQKFIGNVRQTAGQDLTDVTKNPLIQNIIGETVSAGNTIVNRLLRKAQIGTGDIGNTGAGKDISNVLKDVVKNISGNLLSFQQNEQQRKDVATQQLGNVGTQKLGLVEEYGDLPRLLNQLRRDASFNQAMTSLMFPYTTQAPIAQNLLSQERYGFDPGVSSPSQFSQIGNFISGIV